VSWTAPASLGSADASLTNPSGGRYRLFSTTTEIAGAPALDARFGRRLTRVIQVELAASYSSPTLRSSISDDAENGAALVATESIRQIAITGAAVFHVARWRIASRILPFVTAGGGYLRQLHQGDTLVETGRIYFAGGGGTIPLGSRGRSQGGHWFGIRADVRALFQAGGVSLGAERRVSPSVTAAAFVRF
jgi:opacity protein-like surface antigen